ncbi:S1C family serine protease [Maridesulfovibrio bastinii]|uniref:S1C family serine protease n=1 Tax=Maridesulfovibrio bastinii TaxID=47157 RepID=UPI000423FB95|nr:S1C family serine protease [Maridesulfovibrio bastinii]
MIKNSTFILFESILLILICTACNPGVKPVPIPDHSNLPAIQNTTASQFEPIAFEKAIITLKRGESIGALPAGFSEDGNFCNFPNGLPLKWGEGKRLIGGRDDDFADFFYDVMNNQGYNVVGNPSVIFDREKEFAKAKYRVAARIKKLTTNICQEDSLWDGHHLNRVSGEMYIEVEWTVYSNITKSSVLKISTTGYNKIVHGIYDGNAMLLMNSFNNAAENLAATPKFHDLLLKTNLNYTEFKPIGDVVLIKPQKLFSTNLDQDPSRITNAVVTVRNGGGHGSGFLISDNGYILTNAHVVGESKEVPVRIEGKFELMGKVLKSDIIRDVALIKVPLSSAAALPLNLSIPKPSSRVYAIGTPLSLNYEKSITSGIVSALRYEIRSKENFIQADVDIQPGNSGGPLVDVYGNVIGISCKGIMNTGASIGMNFFIPISTALNALNIKIKN